MLYCLIHHALLSFSGERLRRLPIIVGNGQPASTLPSDSKPSSQDRAAPPVANASPWHDRIGLLAGNAFLSREPAMEQATLNSVMASTVARGLSMHTQPTGMLRTFALSGDVARELEPLPSTLPRVLRLAPLPPSDMSLCSIRSVLPGLLHILDEATLRGLSHASVFIHRDADIKLCCCCRGLDVVHMPSCLLSLRNDRCMFCCGCYAKDRQGIVRDAPAAAGAAYDDDGTQYDSCPYDGGDVFDADDEAVAPRMSEKTISSEDVTGFDGAPSRTASTSELADVAVTSIDRMPSAATTTVDARDVIAGQYGDLLADSEILFEFTDTKYPTFAVPGPCVSIGDQILHLDDVPLPSWCESAPRDTCVRAADVHMALDKTKVFVIQLIHVRVNDSDIDVPVCSCDRYVADNVRRLLLFSAKLVDVPPNRLLSELMILELRRLLQQQQGCLPRDILVCLHVHGLMKGLALRRHMVGGCGPRLTGQPVVTPATESSPRATVGFLAYCSAYCVALLVDDGSNGCTDAGIVIRRQTFKFACPAASCAHAKQRCLHLRCIAARISAGRAVDDAFVLGSREHDDAILAQVSAQSPDEARSSRTPEESWKRLDSHTQGPLPLSLREAKETQWPFLAAVQRRSRTWATVLSPESISVCPRCKSSLGACSDAVPAVRQREGCCSSNTDLGPVHAAICDTGVGHLPVTSARYIPTAQTMRVIASCASHITRLLLSTLLALSCRTALSRWTRRTVSLPHNVSSSVLLHRGGVEYVTMFELVCPHEDCGHVLHYSGLEDGYFVKSNYLVADLQSTYGTGRLGTRKRVKLVYACSSCPL